MSGAHAARAIVEQAVERFVAATERERLVLYRMHLQATVRSISPFTLAFAEHLGVDLEDGMNSMRPPWGWPWRPRPSTMARSAGRNLAARHYLHPKVRAVHGLLHRYVTNHGFVHFGEGRDMLLFEVDGPWISMQGRIGDCAVRVVKGMAALTLPVGFPETLAVAMVGRPVDAAIASPALSGRGYRVRWVREAAAGGGPTLVFPTGRRRFAMPWPDLLTAAGSEGAAGRMPAGRPGQEVGVRCFAPIRPAGRTGAHALGGGA